MSLQRDFESILDDLWLRRTASLCGEVLARPRVKKLVFSKAVRDKLLQDLLDVTTKIVLRDSDIRDKYDEGVLERRYTQILGRGYEKKFSRIFDFTKDFVGDKSFVYIFWQNRKCLYVGQAGTYRRIRAYQKSYYLNRATRFEILLVKRRSELTMQECMTQHYLNPKDTKVKPAHKSWGRRCPICAKHDRSRTEILDIFSLKKTSSTKTNRSRR